MFGAIASGINNFANQVVSYNYNRSQRSWLEKQQRLAQFYNLNLAKQQNSWNIEQWNRENSYNSPSAQMRRYSQAGLNPDLVYSQGNLAAQSPMLTSGAPTSPLGSDAYGERPNWSNIVNDALQSMLLKAQVSNTEADTKNKEADTDKKGEETKGLSIDNLTRALKNGKEIEELGVRIRFGESNIELNSERMKEVQKNCEVLAQTVSKLREEVDLTRAEVDLKRDLLTTQRMERLISQMRLFLDSEKCAAEIAHIAQQTELTKEQVKSAIIHNTADKLRLPVEQKMLELSYKEKAAYEKYFGDMADNAMKRDAAITYSTVEEHNAKGHDYGFWNYNSCTRFLYTITQHWRSLIGAIKH